MLYYISGKEIIMNEVTEFLKKNSVQFLATLGLDGKPKVRPFQYMLENGGKLYFCTGNTKDVYNEMVKQPYIEVSCSAEDFSWIRLKGKVIFTGDPAIKKEIIEASPLVKSIYKTPDNPQFEVFFIDEAEATISDFSGNPPRSFKL